MKSKESKFATFLKKYWPLLGYLLVSIIFLFSLLRQQGIPFKYDWGWPFFNLKDFWRGITETGTTGLLAVLSKNAYILVGSLGFLKIPPEVVLKIILVCVHTFAGYSFYLFLHKRIKNNLVAFVAGLAYAFSPYIFIRTILGYIWSLVAYALLPFFLDIYFTEQKGLRSWIFKCLLLGFLFSLIFAQIQAGVLLSFLLIVNLISSIFFRNFKTRLISFLQAHLGLLLFTLPWLFIFILNRNDLTIAQGQDIIALNYIASLSHSLRNIFMLSDHHITSDFFYTLSHNVYYLAGFCLVWLVAILGVFNRRNREIALTLFVSMLILVPFLKGPSGIFGSVYSWFFEHLPQIAIFRETYHFQFLFSVIILLLFAFGLETLFFWLKSLRLGNLMTVELKALFIGSLIFVIAPYFTFNYAGYLKPIAVPREYHDLYIFFQGDKNVCKKIYYPPGLGFVYFLSDQSVDAANSDVLASSLGLPYLDEGTSVSDFLNPERLYRNEVVSEFYEKSDNGEFVGLLNEGGIDCLVFRLDMGTKYSQATNLRLEKDPQVIKKWYNPDLLSLAKSKKGLTLFRTFGQDIYLFKAENQTTITMDNRSNIQQLPESLQSKKILYLPIAHWANYFAFYQDGWSRGRYDFWRKLLFTQLRQDFIYTTRENSVLSGQIDADGDYELYVRYLDGGTEGNVEIKIQDTRYKIQKKPGEEKFVVKDLEKISIKKGDKVEIKNISGENAIADIVLAPGD